MEKDALSIKLNCQIDTYSMYLFFQGDVDVCSIAIENRLIRKKCSGRGL